MKKLDVIIPAPEATKYEIHVGRDMLSGLLDTIRSEWKGRRLFVVTDENLVETGHFEKLIGDSVAPEESFIVSPPGEEAKTIDAVVAMVEAMEQAYYGRDTLVTALGGGVVGDMAGFAAAIFKRGVPVIQIPTTPVAQADSSVGGKTGVDSSVSKNAFGAFHQPAAVYIDVATLQTLDDRVYRAGLVESVKHALICDAEYFDYIEKHIEEILERDANVLEEMMYRNCRIKAAVVQEDPTEKNQRRILNYGHTVGHAVESASDYQLLHGEAVAIGIRAAGMIEAKLGLHDDAMFARVLDVLKKLDMPLEIPASMGTQDLLDLLAHDKKSVGRRPRFVLLNTIGEVHRQGDQWAMEVDPQIVEDVLNQLRA